MKLSIIIPVYNAEKYLDECLESICSEIKKDFEIIAINDGSKDSSQSILEKYQKKYNKENICVIEKENSGASDSRNYGIKQAKGKYLMFVDADDFLTPGWSTIINDVITSKDDDIVFFGEKNNINFLDKRNILDAIFKLIEKNSYIYSTPWSKILKTKVVKDKDIKFINKIINGEDMLFNAEMLLNSKTFSFEEKTIYNYRVNNASITHRFNKKIFDSNTSFLKYIEKIFINSNIDYRRYYEYCLENSILMFIERLCFCSKKDIKDYFQIFEVNPYKNGIKNKKHFNSAKDKFMYTCLKNRNYKLAINSMKIIKKIVGLKHKNKKEYIIKI